MIYTGQNDIAAVKAFAAKVSKNRYAIAYIDFGKVFVNALDKLPTSKHAPNDYPLGYWVNGVHKNWSEKRVIENQNACNTKD